MVRVFELCDICWSSELVQNEICPLDVVFFVGLNYWCFLLSGSQCTRWQTQIWAGFWRVRRSRKHFVHLSMYFVVFFFVFFLLVTLFWLWWAPTSGPCFWPLIILEVLSISKSYKSSVAFISQINLLLLPLQQEDQTQSAEEESSEEFEDNAQTEPLRQDSKTSCHLEARPCCKYLVV